jgi:hypothetical protein
MSVRIRIAPLVTLLSGYAKYVSTVHVSFRVLSRTAALVRDLVVRIPSPSLTIFPDGTPSCFTPTLQHEDRLLDVIVGKVEKS